MDSIRLDVWLDIACLFKTRSEAQKACKGGKVNVNGQAAKSHRDVRAGDEVVITRPLGRRQKVIVCGIAEHHIARARARELYQDVTPAPTPEEMEVRRMVRMVRPFGSHAAGAPDKRERRALRRLKERG